MKYYIILNDVHLGPLDLSELRRLPVTAQTPVWREGMADWTPCGDVTELSSLFVSEPVAIGRPRESYDPYAASFNSGKAKEDTVPDYAPGQPDNWIPECPPTYLVWSILVTLFCCMPFGIVAVVKSCGVTSSYNRGDYEAARKKSSDAQMWIIVSVVLGLVWGVIAVGFEFARSLF